MLRLQPSHAPGSPRIINNLGDDDLMDAHFASLSLVGKLPGVRDVLVSPTNSVGSIVRYPRAVGRPSVRTRADLRYLSSRDAEER